MSQITSDPTTLRRLFARAQRHTDAIDIDTDPRIRLAAVYSTNVARHHSPRCGLRGAAPRKRITTIRSQPTNNTRDVSHLPATHPTLRGCANLGFLSLRALERLLIQNGCSSLDVAFRGGEARKKATRARSTPLNVFRIVFRPWLAFLGVVGIDVGALHGRGPH